jgi:hypothetical protein
MRMGKLMGLVGMVTLLSLVAVVHAATAWLDVYSGNGKRGWQMPEGWTTLAGIDEENGDYLVYDAPDGSGRFAIAAYGAQEGTCPAFVENAAKGAKAKKVKNVLCAEGKDGDKKIAACAREDKSGTIYLLTLTVTPETYKQVGGLGALRQATLKTYGIVPIR